ncbi:MAG: HNH endonuclease [Planctomycetes bacterium]|nr:HNH endonuclease [Planctomycetota bacterium]
MEGVEVLGRGPVEAGWKAGPDAGEGEPLFESRGERDVDEADARDEPRGERDGGEADALVEARSERDGDEADARAELRGERDGDEADARVEARGEPDIDESDGDEADARAESRGEPDIDESDGDEADALVDAVREAAADCDGATLRAARAFEMVERSRAHREMGIALLGDLATRLGVAPRRARELLDLGRALREYPGLGEGIRAGRIPLEKAVAVAPAMVARRWPLAEWTKEIRARDVGSLRALSRRETRSRVVDGRRLMKDPVDLSAEARAMLFDLQAKFSRLRARDAAVSGERPIPMSRTDVLEKAIRLALDLVRDGASVGERLYRIAEHAPGSFEIVAADVGGELHLLRAERGRFDLVQAPPEDVAGVVARLKKRHGTPGGDLLDIAGRALAEGVFATEKRPLAYALVEEIREALRGEKAGWCRVARAMVSLDRLGVPDWREWVACVIRRSLATVSELLSCGKAAANYPPLAEALESGRLGWTHVRTLAPYLDDENFEWLFSEMLHQSVRELEATRKLLAGALGREPRRSPAAGKGTGLPPLEIELPDRAWRDLEELAKILGKKKASGVSFAEAIEEALWQALAKWGAPSPLWEAYRILVHHDRETGLSWMVGPGEIVTVAKEELARIRARGAHVYDVEAEEAAARRRERDRLAGALGGRGHLDGSGAREGAGAGKLSREEALARAIAEALALPGRTPEPEMALRRLVYIRDGCRCSVCGCRAALFVHVHHLDPRAEGGGNDPDNLALLCWSCHSVTHSNHGKLVPRTPAGTRIFTLQALRTRAGSREGCVRTLESSDRTRSSAGNVLLN